MADKDRSQTELAEQALALKQQAEQPQPQPQPPGAADGAQTGAETGMRPIPRPDYPASGAFDAEGQRPVLERSRKVR